MRMLFFTGIIGIACSSPGIAQEPAALTIHPQAIESPPLKYRLLPPEAELKEGHAAPILLRLPWEQTSYITSDKFRDLDRWNELPLASDEWMEFPKSFSSRFVEEMKRAAYRRDAGWEYPIGEEPPYFILLPDAQGMRQWLLHGLSAKIRYDLSRGKLDEAREGILVGLANARHVAATPFLVNQLVANAIHRRMLDRVGELISQRESPNLYWALSTLPESLLELERAADMEGSAFLLTFPAAADLDRPRDAAEWKKMLKEFNELNRYLNAAPPNQIKAAEDDLASLAKIARTELPVLKGHPAERALAMSDEEAAFRWLIHMRLEHDQREAAVLCLPPQEALPLLKQMRTRYAALAAKIGVARAEWRDPTSGYIALWSLKRRIAALRIVEAVRHHLVSNGKLPATLAEITAVPVPLDPMTAQPFVWKIEGNSATLRAPELPDDLAPRGPTGQHQGMVEYRLEVKS